MRTKFCITLLVLAACQDPAAPTARPVTRGFVTVANNVRLEYLDYGGPGAPLILLAGLGHTAHVFETFAPRLTDRYRVVSLTRRGFGASSHPADRYDTPSLARDVAQAMDALHIARASLVGHSVAGDEITRFSRDYPGRVQKVVYLDGAYDRVQLGSLIEAHPFPDAPAPDLLDISSVAGFTRYLSRVRGVTLPEAEVRATYVFGASGAVEREATEPEVYGALFAGIEAPRYSAVQVPALAIYAVPQDAGDVLPWLSPTSPGWAAAQDLIASVYVPFYRTQRERFAREVSGSRSVELPGASHYVFLSDPARVAREIREFLGTN